jgi:hypothetical protein
MFIVRPIDNCGGCTRSITPKSAAMTPSLHFWVAPPRKQARTGSAGTARFNHQRPGAPVKLAGFLDVLIYAVGIGGVR